MWVMRGENDILQTYYIEHLLCQDLVLKDQIIIVTKFKGLMLLKSGRWLYGIEFASYGFICSKVIDI